MKKYLIFSLLFLTVIISGCSSKQTNKNKAINNSDVKSANTQRETAGLVPLAVSTTTDLSATSTVNINKSISSNKLGIKVSYYSDLNNEVWSKEEGNKIYFWNKFYKDNYKEGQNLELFTKTKEESFVQTIENKFLSTEKYKNNCFVKVVENTDEYQKAIIDFKSPDTSPNHYCINGDPSRNCDSCPAHYSKTNASLYFIYYKNQPDKYFYFTLGQASLIRSDKEFWYGSSDKREWFNNVEFIK